MAEGLGANTEGLGSNQWIDSYLEALVSSSDPQDPFPMCQWCSNGLPVRLLVAGSRRNDLDKGCHGATASRMTVPWTRIPSLAKTVVTGLEHRARQEPGEGGEPEVGGD